MLSIHTFEAPLITNVAYIKYILLALSGYRTTKEVIRLMLFYFTNTGERNVRFRRWHMRSESPLYQTS